MIHFSLNDNRVVKHFFDFPEEEMGFHSQFGLIRESKAIERHRLRKKRGLKSDLNAWEFKFIGKEEKGKVKIKPLSNCQVIESGIDKILLKTSKGSLTVHYQQSLDNVITPSVPTWSETKEKERDYLLVILLAVFLLFLSIFLFFTAMEKEEKPEDKEVLKIEVVSVPTKTVKIPATVQKMQKKLTKTQKAHRAVKQNFGFLGLLGKKTLTKAVGGAETKLKKATAGAGAGGDAGSGGEYLAGLGAGVKKITVGNTGVRGLGGVGTKGKGGGKGGYGTASVASGEGSGLSTLAVSDEMVLSGGLDRYVIKATIAKYLNQVRACYEKGLADNPKLAGEVRVAFEIGATGSLNYSRVSRSSLGNKTVEKCITTKMMSWIFPKPRGGMDVKVKYPFMLRPVTL